MFISENSLRKRSTRLRACEETLELFYFNASLFMKAVTVIQLSKTAEKYHTLSAIKACLHTICQQ